MKDIVNKRFWIIFWTLNSCFALIYLAFAYLNYSLILGHIAGCLTFLFFICCSSLLFRQKNSNKDIKIKLIKAKNVMFFILISIGTLLIVSIFFLVNYFYRKYVDKTINLFFYIINFLTFATPFLTFTITCIVEVILSKKIVEHINVKGAING